MVITHMDSLSNEVVEDLKLLRPTTIVSPSQYFAGFNRDGTETQHTGQEDESASGPEWELVRCPPDQTQQLPLASKICTSPKQSTILPSRPYAQEEASEDSIDEGSRISNQDMDSQYWRDYPSTIAFPDEEVHDKAVALFDFAKESEDELPLKEGQIIWVCSQQSQGWVMAEDPRTGELGFVPEKFVRLLPDVEGSWSTLSGEQPANKERLTDVDTPSNISWSCTNVSAEKRNTNGDVKEVTEKHVTVDTHQEALSSRKLPRKRMQASAEPSQPSDRRTSIIEDPVDSFDQWGIIPITISSELYSSEITHRSNLSAKNGTPSSQRKEKRRGGKPVVQQVARGSPHVESPLPRTPVSINGIPGTNVRGEAQRGPATHRLRRRVERAAHEGQYDLTGTTKLSEEEGLPEIVRSCDTNPEIERKDEVSTEKVTYNSEKASRKKERESHRRRRPAAERVPIPVLTAAALDMFNDVSDSEIPNRGSGRRRAKDNGQDSGFDPTLLPYSMPECGDGFASKSSTGPDRVLYENVENAIRRLIGPELKILQQEQVRKFLSRKPSKPASVPNPFENPKVSPNRDEKNTEICEDTDLTADISRPTDRTSHCEAEDGSPVMISRKKRRDSRDKSRESTLAVARNGIPRPGSRSTSRDTIITTDTSKTPSRRRSRSLSKERPAHKAMEQLARRPRKFSGGKHKRSSNTRSRSVNNE